MVFWAFNLSSKMKDLRTPDFTAYVWEEVENLRNGVVRVYKYLHMKNALNNSGLFNLWDNGTAFRS